jgi:hypothetical protein
MKKIRVTAIPHDQFDAFFRAGRRWGKEPEEAFVLDPPPKRQEGQSEADYQKATERFNAAAPKGDNILTFAQYEQLKAEHRLRIDELGDEATPGTAAAAPPPPAATSTSPTPTPDAGEGTGKPARPR